jgi:hypothetical protein
LQDFPYKFGNDKRDNRVFKEMKSFFKDSPTSFLHPEFHKNYKAWMPLLKEIDEAISTNDSQFRDGIVMMYETFMEVICNELSQK